MNRTVWLEQYLEKVSWSSTEGWEAVEYVRSHKIKVGLRQARKSVGAFWTISGRIYLNSRHYPERSALDDPRAICLLVHEVRHLQQGPLTALSVYGELEAWQIDFHLFKVLTKRGLNPNLEELLQLPLNLDRANLRRARALMMKHAGRGYLVWLLPLYPIIKEIKYWLTGRS